MKKILLILGLVICSLASFGQYQEISNGESGLSVRNKHNTMNAQLYDLNVTVSFSSDNINYHDDWITGDVWVRYSTDLESTWSDGVYLSFADPRLDSIRFDSDDGYLRSYIDGSVTDSTSIDGRYSQSSTIGDSIVFNISDGYLRLYSLIDVLLDSTSIDNRYFLLSDTTGLAYLAKQNTFSEKQILSESGLILDGSDTIPNSGAVYNAIEAIDTVLNATRRKVAVLAWGQSNMVGARAAVNQDTTTDRLDRFYAMDITNDSTGVFVLADLHNDPFTGSSINMPDTVANNLAYHFCRNYAEVHDVDVYLLLIASSGKNIEYFLQDTTNTDNGWIPTTTPTFADRMRKLSMRFLDSLGIDKYTAIIGHQGESNFSSIDDTEYSDKVEALITELWSFGVIDTGQTAIVMGEVSILNARHDEHLRELQEVESRHKNFAIAGSKGLTQADNTHFDGLGLTEMGHRYFNAFRDIGITETIENVVTAESDFSGANYLLKSSAATKEIEESTVIESSGNLTGIADITATGKGTFKSAYILSTNSSDSLNLSHNNSNAYITTDDGGIWLYSVENGAANSVVYIGEDNDSYSGTLRIYGNDSGEYSVLQAISDGLRFDVYGTSDPTLHLQPQSTGSVKVFALASSGEAPTMSWSGYMTGDARRTMGLTISGDTANVATIEGLLGYWFNGKVIANSLKIPTGAGLGKILQGDALGNATWATLPASTVYKGTLNGTTGVPTAGGSALIDGTGTSGWEYIAAVAGTHDYGNPSGNSIALVVGQSLIYNGTTWESVPVSGSVTAVNGLTGSVTLYPQLSGNLINIVGDATTIDISSATAVAANSGKDTTGIYHTNRTDLDLIEGTNTGDQDTTYFTRANSAFAADNRIITSDGTGRNSQASGITISDLNNVTGVNLMTGDSAHFNWYGGSDVLFGESGSKVTFNMDSLISNSTKGVKAGSGALVRGDSIVEYIDRKITEIGAVTQLSDLSDVVSATNTDRFALMANGSSGYVGRALEAADISDLSASLLWTEGASGSSAYITDSVFIGTSDGVDLFHVYHDDASNPAARIENVNANGQGLEVWGGNTASANVFRAYNSSSQSLLSLFGDGEFLLPKYGLGNFIDNTPTYLVGVNAGGGAFAEVELSSITGINISGTPANNQLAVWVDEDTQEGDSNLEWNGSVFSITGFLNVGSSINITGAADFIVNTDKFSVLGASGNTTIEGDLTSNSDVFIPNISAGTTDTIVYIKMHNGQLVAGLAPSGGGGEVDTTGLPVAEQVAYFTEANKIGGSEYFTYDGTDLVVNGDFEFNNGYFGYTTPSLIFDDTDIVSGDGQRFKISQNSRVLDFQMYDGAYNDVMDFDYSSSGQVNIYPTLSLGTIASGFILNAAASGNGQEYQFAASGNELQFNSKDGTGGLDNVYTVSAIDSDNILWTWNNNIVAHTVQAYVASTTQSQGQTPMFASVCNVSTVSNANDVVTMPSAVSGMEVKVANNGANTLQIYPASGDDLGSGVNTSITLAAGSNATYVAIDATNWETF